MAKIMTIRASDKLQEELMKKARKQGITRNALILDILWNWLKEKNNEGKERRITDERTSNH